jgi:hypothetical protein
MISDFYLKYLYDEYKKHENNKLLILSVWIASQQCIYVCNPT